MLMLNRDESGPPFLIEDYQPYINMSAYNYEIVSTFFTIFFSVSRVLIIQNLTIYRY